MIYKKTFWMNVVALIIALPFSLNFLLTTQNDFLTSQKPELQVFYFETIYICLSSIITPLFSAYALKTKSALFLSTLTNYINLLFVASLAIYTFIPPHTYLRGILRVAAFIYIFLVVIPSIINIRALSKMEK